jgi:hypothetical protein
VVGRPGHDVMSEHAHTTSVDCGSFTAPRRSNRAVFVLQQPLRGRPQEVTDAVTALDLQRSG